MRTASIIINNYNYGQYLPAAIESSLAQTYPHVQVVVVDDGSTDHSPAVLRRYADRVIPVLKENGGQASAFNAGFAASTGEVVLFLDADDLLLPTAVEAAVAALADPAVVKVHWPLRVVDASGHLTGRLYPNRPLSEGDLREWVLRHGPNNYVNAPTSGNAWSRRFLSEVLPAGDNGDGHGADAYLFTLAPFFGRIARLAEPQSYYRVHGSNFSGRTLLDRVRRDLARYNYYCQVLSNYLMRTRIAADPQGWKSRDSYYGWMDSMRAALEALVERVPVGETFILVDEDQWGTEALVAGRKRLPFLEHGGQYWGAPPDDETAVRELERLREAGASWLAFAPHTFWWLEHYRGLARHLDDRYERVLHHPHLRLFRLDVTAAARLNAAPAAVPAAENRGKQ